MSEESREIVAAEPAEGDGGSDLPVRAEALGFELPDDHDEAVDALLEALATSRASADAYLDDLQRLAAEFENYRKRVARDREEIVERSSERLVAALLPVLDSFRQAAEHEPQTPGEAQMLSGMHGTHQQLLDVLAAEGLEPIDAEGRPFDPTVHEAIGGSVGDDLVVSSEVRRGYLLKGRVVRPAMVMVSEPEEQSGDEDG
jgi:molecular chaperone GrpE